MDKLQYVDYVLLEQKIVESGLKIKFICETLGLSRTGFDKKRNGLIPFKAAEIYVLCDLLRITAEERSKIFCPK